MTRSLISIRIAIFSVLILSFFNCKDDDPISETPIVEVPETSPVTYEIDQNAFPKLSDYNFFEGNLMDQNPVYGVLPYEPITQLFTDYAHKKRFVWMPEGVKATYTHDYKILDFPVGSILIKSFYYDNVLPNNTTEFIETRLMIRKTSGWIFADYVWNDEQTEAFLDLSGSFKNISWQQNGETLTTNYQIPAEGDCLTCHKNNEIASPIGVKPQNINKTYAFISGNQNQLAKWKEFGYLDSYPSNINTVIDWEDSSQPIQDRVRSYLDINCSHCHVENGHCDYTPMRFAYNETTSDDNLGICIPNVEPLPGYEKLILPGDANRSILNYRMNTNDANLMMPIIGRTIVHQEAVDLMNEWVNGLTQSCN